MGVLGFLVGSQRSIQTDVYRNVDELAQKKHMNAYGIDSYAENRIRELESLDAKSLRRLVNRLHGGESIMSVLDSRW